MAVRKKKKTPYDLQDYLPFGVYKDNTVKHVLEREPKYIHWLWAVCEFEFTDAVWDELRKREKGQAGKSPIA